MIDDDFERAYSMDASDHGLDGNAMPSGATVGQALGEVTWLLTQSTLHRSFKLSDLEWFIMPALLLRQFYVTRENGKPIGLALWANCGPDAVAKLEAGVIQPENRLTLEEWNCGDQTWLVDLVTPFADHANKHREAVLAGLITGPLSGKKFSFHYLDPSQRKRSVQHVEADAADRLTEAIEAQKR